MAFYRGRAGELCADCQVRLEQNPLRLLDCKTDVALRAEAPDVQEFWCRACRDHLRNVMALVEVGGYAIERDRFLVRGLDYYTRTVFEVGHPTLGDRIALFGGGRYDGLTASLGGAAAPAVGFGMGIERMLSALPQPLASPMSQALYVAHWPGFEATAHQLAQTLRRAGIAVVTDVMDRSLKAQLKDASRRVARTVLVGGDADAQDAVIVRDLNQGTQTVVAKAQLAMYLQRGADKHEPEYGDL